MPWSFSFPKAINRKSTAPEFTRRSVESTEPFHKGRCGSQCISSLHSRVRSFFFGTKRQNIIFVRREERSYYTYGFSLFRTIYHILIILYSNDRNTSDHHHSPIFCFDYYNTSIIIYQYEEEEEEE